jgi:hypothetical protein
MRAAWLKDLRLADLPQVGGKNASLGEMIGALSAAGIRVPGGFATTADAFRDFLAQGGLDRKIEKRLEALDPKDIRALTACGTEIRSWIVKQPFPADLEKEIVAYFHQLEKKTSSDTSFAVRSSATAEDLPDASFAGQQETFLNIRGADHVLAAIRRVFASLYNDRAISYRAHQGFAHGDVALSAAVQQMVAILDVIFVSATLYLLRESENYLFLAFILIFVLAVIWRDLRLVLFSLLSVSLLYGTFSYFRLFRFEFDVNIERFLTLALFFVVAAIHDRKRRTHPWGSLKRVLLCVACLGVGAAGIVTFFAAPRSERAIARMGEVSFERCGGLQRVARAQSGDHRELAEKKRRWIPVVRNRLGQRANCEK